MKCAFLLLILFVNTNLWGQDVWQDYILGRPINGLTEAKATVAERWGIKYKAILGGCIVDDTTSTKMKNYQNSNEAYLQKIATKYGKNWQAHYDWEVKIELLKKNQYLQGKWIEPILMSDYDKELYQKKQTLARSWGLVYEVLPIEDPKVLSAEESQKIELGNRYVQQISGTLGEDWVSKFNAIFARLKQKQQSTIPETWHEYLLDEVEEDYYHKKQKVLADWGIKYEPHFVACCKNKEKKMREGNYTQKAMAVQEKINILFGNDWQESLEIAIQKQLPWK